MRINKYNSLEKFTSQYIGEWAPSDNHWFGLDFSYNGTEYRFNTGSMYEQQNTVLPNSKKSIAVVKRMNTKEIVNKHRYSNQWL